MRSRAGLRRARLEVVSVGFLPAVFYRSDIVGLVVEMKTDRSLVGFVAGIRVDVDRERHG